MRLSVGVEYDLPPVPLVPDDTSWFPAGAVAFGLEQRVLDEAVIARTYDDESRAGSRIDQVKSGHVTSDGGPSIHVCDGQTGAEYLRFDCFREQPHYHYLPVGGGNTAVAHDSVANGPMTSWALATLRSRLAPLLEHVGAAPVAQRLDGRLVEEALASLERHVDVRGER